LVTGDFEDSARPNRQALTALLEGQAGDIIRKRLRVLTGARRFPVLLHAKLERLPWNRRAHWRPAEGVERGVFTEWEALTPGPGEPPYAERLC
jgi:hypothetical protein